MSGAEKGKQKLDNKDNVNSTSGKIPYLNMFLKPYFESPFPADNTETLCRNWVSRSQENVCGSRKERTKVK